MTIRLSHRNLPECSGKVYAGVNLGLAQPRQAFIDTRQSVGILDGHLVQRAEVAAEAQLPVFLFYHYNATRPRGQRGPYHPQGQEVSHLLIGTLSFFRGAPSRCGTAPGSTSTVCLAIVHRPISALCFMNRSSNSLRILPRDSQALAPHKSLTSCN